MSVVKKENHPIRVLIISASQRRQYNCPGIDSKSRMLMLRMKELLPKDWEIDFEDLGNSYRRRKIQSCNACVSTSMALCVWPCNCYEKNNKREPDLMWDIDMYTRLDIADAWAVIGPVNWYGPTSNLKLMFDRLVCMNGGNPRPDLINHKNPEMAQKLENSAQWKELSVNHLEGRSAAFFCHGDGGGDDLDENGIPKNLKHKEYFNPKQEPFQDMRQAYAPLVWQCRYSGIEVPDNLWKYKTWGYGKSYADNQAEDIHKENSFGEFDDWVNNFKNHVEKKGKIEPGKYRAYGHKPAGHLISDIKLGLRSLKMRAGKPAPDSSPDKQQKLGLNRDVSWIASQNADLEKASIPESK